MTHKDCKTAIRYFLQSNYTDERLAMLLAHAQSGRLAYNSCCCFVGVATANHGALASSGEIQYFDHLSDAMKLKGGVNAELAYRYLGGFDSSDEVRRRRLIPMIRAEIRRRDRLAEARRAPVVATPARKSRTPEVLAVAGMAFLGVITCIVFQAAGL